MSYLGAAGLGLLLSFGVYTSLGEPITSVVAAALPFGLSAWLPRYRAERQRKNRVAQHPGEVFFCICARSRTMCAQPKVGS